jgi:hypothetical protein
MYLQRKPCLLDAEATSILLPCDNWLSFWNEYSLEISLQGRERLILFHICSYFGADQTYVSLERKPCMLEDTASVALFPFDNWVGVWNEYFLAITIFKVYKVIFFMYTFSPKLKKHMYLSKKKKPSVLEAGASSTFFPVRSELAFQRNTSCNLRNSE